MVRDHNTRFQKFLAALGKRVIWWRQRKMSALFLSITSMEYTRLLMEIDNVNLEAALKEFKQIGNIAGQDLMFEYMDTSKILFSKSLEDVPLMVRVSWYISLGEDIPAKNFRFIPKGAEGDQYDKVVWTSDHCLFCACLDEGSNLVVNKETLGNESWVNQIGGIIKAAMQIIQEYVGNDYELQVKETKCMQTGDSCQEFTIWFIPKED